MGWFTMDIDHFLAEVLNSQEDWQVTKNDAAFVIHPSSDKKDDHNEQSAALDK
jgi:hypothetical protein